MSAETSTNPATSAQPPTSTEPKEKKDILKRLINRVKKLIRKDKSQTSGSAAGPVPQPTTSEAQPAIVKTSTTPAATSKPAAAAETTRPTKHPSVLQREKAQALFKKHGLELTDDEWSLPDHSEKQVQRVEKPIRMRVRWQCHECQTFFGSNKTCSKCSHERCRRCHRIPPRKPRDKTKSTGPRSCHRCNAVFEENSRVCAQCQHRRCKSCPSVQAKDEVSSKPGVSTDAHPTDDTPAVHSEEPGGRST